MPKFFADLHCHPTMYSFNRMRHVPELEKDPTKFHAWNIMPSNLKDMEQGKRASAYSQSGFDKCHKAGVRLLFASFTPIEKGFFQGNTGKQEHPFVLEALKFVSGATMAKSSLSLLKGEPAEAAKQFGHLLKNRGPLRKLVQTFAMKYDPRHIQFMMSNDFDYWEEFLLEYQFLKQSNGKLHNTQVTWMEDGKVIEEPIQGRYWIVNNREHFKSILNEHDTDLAIILTIEGGHVFSLANDETTLPKNIIMDRITALKQMPHPIMFITIAHHFDNGFCGHAHSMMDAMGLVADQTPRMHEGFETKDDLGRSVVRHLLDIDEKLEPQGNRRILIDCKHMSAQTRAEYYEDIVKPYNDAHAQWPKKKQKAHQHIPVLFSHAAYSGINTLDELIDNAPKEHDNWSKDGYYSWNINVCDDDVRMVHQTDGLIGLVFDQRVAGVKQRDNIPKVYWPNIILRHIFDMVDVIFLDDRLGIKDKRKIWDCICLGTDFDGFIDPITCYPTVLDLPAFAEDLRAALEAQKHTRQIETIGVDNLVEKICWENIYNFTLKHLTE